MGAQLGVLRLHARVAHEADLHGFEERLVGGFVPQLKHLGIMVVPGQQRRNAHQTGALHGEQRDDDLADQARVAIGRFFQDDHIAGHALERLRAHKYLFSDTRMGYNS